jgi:hypothetical protein
LSAAGLDSDLDSGLDSGFDSGLGSAGLGMGPGLGLRSAARTTGGCGRSTCVSALLVEKVMCSLTDVVAAAGCSAASIRS